MGDAKLGEMTDTATGGTSVHSDLRNSGTGETENSWHSVRKIQLGHNNPIPQYWLGTGWQSSSLTGKDLGLQILTGATVDAKVNMCQLCAPIMNKAKG